jgi:voltage-gated potassium channel
MHFFHTILQFLRTPEYRELLFTTMLVLGFGSVVYHYLEGWNWVDSLYFSVITLTTIGYGDIAPKTDAGKLFTIVYILIGLGIILSFINTVYEHYNSARATRRGSKKEKNDRH